MTVELVPRSRVRPHPENAEIYEHSKPDDWALLKTSIQTHGIRQALVATPDGLLVSGHRRLHIANLLELDLIPVEFKPFGDPDEILEALIDYNLQRHKSVSDKHREAMAIKRILDRRGIKGRTTDHLAKAVGLNSGRQLERIDYVVNEAPSTILDKMNSGEMSPTAAYDQTKELRRQPKEAQQAIEQKLETNQAKDIRQAIQITRQESNAALIEQAQHTPIELTQYGTIVLFPNWDFSELGMKQSGPRGWWTPSQPALTSEEIQAFEYEGKGVPELAAPLCDLFLWCPPLLIPEAFDIARSWGFQVCDILHWHAEVTPAIPMPKRLRHHSYDCVVATTADQIESTDVRDWIYADESRPGFLPEVVYHLVERISRGPYLQIGAQSDRKGWHKL